METLNTNEWLTVKQAMQLLHITSRTTLYNFGKKYGVRVCKPLGKTYFKKADILQKMDEQSFSLGL